jgi:Mg-chelatase subunit ChlD
VDVVFVIDGSTSMMNSNFDAVKEFLLVFAAQTDFSNTRVGFLEFAGPYRGAPGTYQTINANLNVTDGDAQNAALFSAQVSALSAVGGTTDTKGALDFVRTSMFTEANKRPGVGRIVILLTDGFATDDYGSNSEVLSHDAELAVDALRQEVGCGGRCLLLFRLTPNRYFACSRRVILGLPNTFVYTFTFASGSSPPEPF